MIKKTAILGIASLMMTFFSSCENANTSQDATTEVAAESQTDESHSKGQADALDDESNPNILQVAIGSKDHTTLVAAVQAAGIEHILVNAGPLTVFAPVNAAFDALPEGTVETLLKPENKDKLIDILSRHAAAGTYNIKQLKKEAKKGRKVYTATLDYLEVTVEGEDIYIAGAKVLGEVSTVNGYVVVVDKVILPAAE